MKYLITVNDEKTALLVSLFSEKFVRADVFVFYNGFNDETLKALSSL